MVASGFISICPGVQKWEFVSFNLLTIENEKIYFTEASSTLFWLNIELYWVICSSCAKSWPEEYFAFNKLNVIPENITAMGWGGEGERGKNKPTRPIPGNWNGVIFSWATKVKSFWEWWDRVWMGWAINNVQYINIRKGWGLYFGI